MPHVKLCQCHNPTGNVMHARVGVEKCHCLNLQHRAPPNGGCLFNISTNTVLSCFSPVTNGIQETKTNLKHQCIMSLHMGVGAHAHPRPRY